MIQLIGFETEPFSQILWEKDGLICSKTICYSLEDEVEALARLHDINDFYYRYDKAIVIRNDNHQFEIRKAA